MGADCGRAHFRHEAAACATLVGEQLPAVHRERRARALATRGPSQLYCNGVQWVTFKFNLKF